MQIEDAIITNDYGDGILLEEYKGTYGLIATTRGNNEVNYKQWVFTSKWSKAAGGWTPDDKKRPMAVRLGTDPVGVLKKLIAEFERASGSKA